MRHLSEKALAILNQKAENWECFLTFEILEPEIIRLLAEYDNLRTHPQIAGTVLGHMESLTFCGKRLSELNDYVPRLVNLLNVSLPQALGSSGMPSVSERIIDACDQILSICGALFDWEKSFRCTALHSDCEEFADKTRGLTEDYLKEIRRVLLEMRALVEGSAKNQVVKLAGTFDTSRLKGVRIGPSGRHSQGCADGCVALIGLIFSLFWFSIWILSSIRH